MQRRSEEKSLRDCEKSPLHQEHSNINTVGADAYHAARQRKRNNYTYPRQNPPHLCVFRRGFLRVFELFRTGRRGEGELPQRGKRGRPGPRRPLQCQVVFFTTPYFCYFTSTFFTAAGISSVSLSLNCTVTRTEASMSRDTTRREAPQSSSMQSSSPSVRVMRRRQSS